MCVSAISLLKMGCYFTGLNITHWGVAVVSMVTLEDVGNCLQYIHCKKNRVALFN